MNKLFIATILAASLIGTQAMAEWMAVAAGVEGEGDKVSVAAGIGTGDTKEEASMDAVNKCASTRTNVQVLCQLQTTWNTGCGYVVTGTGHDKDGVAVAAFGTGSTKALAKKQFLDSLVSRGATPDEGANVGGNCVRGGS